MKRRGLLLAALALLTAVLAGLWFWWVPLVSVSEGVARGAALWRGEQPLVGRIVGHVSALPSTASRCINCHAGTAGPLGDAGAAPPLTAERLRGRVSRRGGPPSRFDEASFCTLLRTGLDPAAVLVARHMPRYEVGDADCAALWRYLVLPEFGRVVSP